MPALEIIALDTTTPQLRAPSAADTYTAPRAMDITPVALTGSAATSSLSIAQTWNTTGTPTAFDLNVTDTASNASSLLMNLRVGGTSRISVSKTGAVIAVAGANTVSGFYVGGSTANGIYSPSTSQLFLSGNGTVVEVRSSGLGLGASSLSWGTLGTTQDLILARDAANTLAQRNGVNAQAFNIYNTYTDASNYERGFVRWNTNRFEIGADALGVGTRRNTTIFNRDKVGSFGARIDLRLEVDAGAATQALSFIYSGGVPFQWGINGTALGHFATQGFSVGTGDFGGGSGPTTAIDAGFMRIAANITAVVTRPAGTPVGGALEFLENTAPAAPAADRVRIYAEDNGAGKTRLMALFATGAAQQLAVEP